jgi:hypothetical protein
MDLLTALKILELPENYNPEMLKKNYRSMAMKYHPDKNKELGSNDKFLKISQAYEFLNRPITQPNIDLNFIFKSFNPFNLFNQTPVKSNVIIDLTAKEYFTGITKSVKIKENCKCEKCLCICCAGSGFNLNGKDKLLKCCMECLGDGFIQTCNGTCMRTIDIIINSNLDLTEYTHPLVGKIKIKIQEPYYLYNGKLFCKFNITLKESLTGFNKIFKDPFDTSHKININKLIQTNDGYKLNLIDLTLVFNVVYPENLSQSIIAQLKLLDF